MAQGVPVEEQVSGGLQPLLWAPTRTSGSTAGGSHPGRTLVSRVRGRQGHGAAAPPGHAGAPEHAGMEGGVPAGVLGQVVAPHEALVTQGAAEALLTCVCAVVTRQLI